MKKIIPIIAIILVILIGGGLVAKAVIYPIDFKDDIKKYSKEYNVDPYILASLINFETRFEERDYEAGKSNGILNMRDDFAKDLAKKAGIENFDPKTLANPEVSIKLGAFFISQYNSTEEMIMNWAVRAEKEENKEDMKSYAKEYYAPKIEKRAKIYKILNPGL
ncbi:transglycosylase SLT domain-containing protein [Clostridium sp.]|uniref:transglycosylase SLT domain-containing protein n=1 Tax=Clostridium sp. TaxID=1506 RepID=UPI003463CE4C